MWKRSNGKCREVPKHVPPQIYVQLSDVDQLCNFLIIFVLPDDGFVSKPKHVVTN